MSGWSAIQLTEFFSAITRAGDVDIAARLAVERASEATDAEVAAVVNAPGATASLGLGRHADPADLTGLTPASDTVTFPGLGPMHVTVHVLGVAGEGLLMVARRDGEFEAEERQMLHGMARVLGLALRGLRTLANERELRREREREAETRLGLVQALERRERLLETLLRVQRSANQRTPLGDLLGLITHGAADLLDGAPVALVLRDDEEPDGLTVTPANRRDKPVLDAARRAMIADQPIEHETWIAAPVHLGDDMAGSLVIGGPGDGVRDADRHDVLAAFAEQASLAVTGAHTLAAVRAAYHDPLTRLPNRALFLERLEQAVAAGPTAVLFLDLDLFKQVNDSLGHAAGDELLRGVAGRLRAGIRDTDMAARLGGDEFAVLVEPVTGEDDVLQIANRIAESIGRPFRIGGQEVLTRASVGIAFGDRNGRSAENLVEDADLAMYRAKKTMPGTCRVFEAPMRTDLLRQMSLSTEMTRAFDTSQFTLGYQPMVDAASGDLVAVEALLRWVHPELGPVPPATFLPLAEQSGLILGLGRWVLREAGAQLGEWHRAGLVVNLNLNLSGRQLADGGLVGDVRAMLAANRLPPRVLTLEVTEAGLVTAAEKGERHLGELRALGVRLALDGFGAEASSVTVLTRHRFDQLKIAKSVLDSIARDRRCLVIARSLTDIGRRLGMETVAVGIEEEAQLLVLRSMPCDLVQGFLIGQPAAAASISGRAGLLVA